LSRGSTMMPGTRGATGKVPTNRLVAVRVGEIVLACAIVGKPMTLGCSEGTYPTASITLSL
jgi:hypothetical protein